MTTDMVTIRFRFAWWVPMAAATFILLARCGVVRERHAEPFSQWLARRGVRFIS